MSHSFRAWAVLSILQMTEACSRLTNDGLVKPPGMLTAVAVWWI